MKGNAKGINRKKEKNRRRNESPEKIRLQKREKKKTEIIKKLNR